MANTSDGLNNETQAQPLGKLTVQVAHSAAQWQQAKAALGGEHGVGAGCEAGDRLGQLGWEDGNTWWPFWSGARQFGTCRGGIKPWSGIRCPFQTLEAGGTTAPFLVLEATRRPNLASQCLGAGLRELVVQIGTGAILSKIFKNSRI